jgi:HSP20 family protein
MIQINMGPHPPAKILCGEVIRRLFTMSELAKKKDAEKTPQEVQVKRYPSAFEDFDTFLENVFPRFWPGQFDRLWDRRRSLMGVKMPKVDVIDGKDEIKVYVEAPGVKKEDLDVSMTDHTVTIKGKTSRKDETKQADYYRCEIEQGEFSRTITLPAEVEGAKVKAAFQNGMLELTIPKLEQSKRHTVKID